MRLSACLLLLLAALCAPTARGQCVDWTPGYNLAGIAGTVTASALFDDGSGNGRELYLGGTFESAGDVAARNIVKWNGMRWAAVGDGRPAPVTALFVWNTGGTSVLLAGSSGFNEMPVGNPEGSIASWNGSTWSGLAGNASLRSVNAFVVHDDGSGPALYVDASFTNINGSLPFVQAIARFDGATWSTVGSGLFVGSNLQSDLIVFDDGSGPALFAGGRNLYNSPTGSPAPIWKWNGSAWTSASSGWYVNGLASTFSLRHTSAGVELYAAGDATLTNTLSKLMRWNGNGWTGVGAFLPGVVRTLIEVAQPAGDALVYGGGDPSLFNGMGSGGFGIWNGAQWSVSAPLLSTVATLAFHDESGGPKLFAGLLDTASPSLPKQAIKRLIGTTWAPPGPTGSGEEGVIVDLTVVDDGSGPSTTRGLYACGRIAGGATSLQDRVARLEGHTWTPVGTPFSNSVFGVRGYDDGVHGEQLYAVGTFTSNNGVGMNRVARWDGSFWQQLGAGIGGVGYEAAPTALATYDDDNTVRLIVLGNFNLAGGMLSPFIAGWDGTQWSTFGTGFDLQTTCAVAVDEGSVRALYVGGYFHTAGGVPAERIARWNGTSWSAVGTGLPYPPRFLLVHDDGTGPKLYAAPAFGTTLRKWNGSSWQNVPGAPQTLGGVASWDDGSGAGPRLCVLGDFTTVYGACFDGTTWSPMGTGLSGTANSAAVFDDGQGPALFVGGNFHRAGRLGSSNIARFGPTGACTPVTGTPYCFGDGTGAACPCGNVGAPQHGCANSMNASGAILVAEGQAHLSSDTVTLRASGMTPNATLLFFQGTGQVAGGLGTSFGDGLRCVNGAVNRLAVRHASAGASSFGNAVAGDPSLSAAGNLGATWSTREYQAWYRDAQSFCSSATYNLTNGVAIRWAP